MEKYLLLFFDCTSPLILNIAAGVHGIPLRTPPVFYLLAPFAHRMNCAAACALLTPLASDDRPGYCWPIGCYRRTAQTIDPLDIPTASPASTASWSSHVPLVVLVSTATSPPSC